MILVRPRPPEGLLGQAGADTANPVQPAHELHDWLRATFVDEGAPLRNEDHQHLLDANLGVLWCSLPSESKGNTVVGLCEEATFVGNRWAKARWEQQIVGWFGMVPDFLLTFHADYADQCSDAAFCALVEHELYHAGQKRDRWGAPRFNSQTGRPVFGIRGHDVEEFVGIVARYGAGNAAGQTRALVDAAGRAPIVCDADITGACGTCGRRAP
ncbi:putative metallopeptidase [Methylobacterium ajmalii]|uniref:Metallopeptidase n=1 Tax=Methylobacterium ajmalii TaxID=2738439 RepID=A0ABU9ZT44_9HYPH